MIRITVKDKILRATIVTKAHAVCYSHFLQWLSRAWDPGCPSPQMLQHEQSTSGCPSLPLFFTVTQVVCRDPDIFFFDVLLRLNGGGSSWLTWRMLRQWFPFRHCSLTSVCLTDFLSVVPDFYPLNFASHRPSLRQASVSHLTAQLVSGHRTLTPDHRPYLISPSVPSKWALAATQSFLKNIINTFPHLSKIFELRNLTVWFPRASVSD